MTSGLCPREVTGACRRGRTAHGHYYSFLWLLARYLMQHAAAHSCPSCPGHNIARQQRQGICHSPVGRTLFLAQCARRLLESSALNRRLLCASLSLSPSFSRCQDAHAVSGVSELDSILTSLASNTWSHGLFRRPSRIFKYNWETARLCASLFLGPRSHSIQRSHSDRPKTDQHQLSVRRERKAYRTSTRQQ